jgi:LysR family glycine cleavage system transcriptional activator
LLRTSLQSPPGLHVDRIELRASTGALLPTTLVTLPGFAGCREHRALLKLLRSA